MHGLVLRGIDDHIYEVIRKRSKEKRQSMNRFIIDIVRSHLGIESETKSQELSKFVGTWSAQDSKTFKNSVKVFEKIDKDMWK